MKKDIKQVIAHFVGSRDEKWCADLAKEITQWIEKKVDGLKKPRYSCPEGCDKSEIMADIKNQIYNQALSDVRKAIGDNL